jgi:hypothetical protein
MSFDDELKRAFKTEDPGAAFTQRVLARLKADASDRIAVKNLRPSAPAASARSPYARVRLVLALAASVSIAAGGAAWVWHVRYVEEGERARAQALMALRLTSEKLNIVRAAVIEVQEPR